MHICFVQPSDSESHWVLKDTNHMLFPESQWKLKLYKQITYTLQRLKAR